MRDESLYSTSTQKQSFDSMNYSDTRTTVMKFSQLDNFDSDYDRDTLNRSNNGGGGGGDFMLGTVNKSSLTGTRFSFNPAGGGGGNTDTEHLYISGTTNALSDDDRFNVTYNRSGDLKISVIPENDVIVVGPQKPITNNNNNHNNSNNNNNNHNQSSIGKWFRSIFHIGRSNSSSESHNNGYYSPPPPEHHNNINLKKINFQLDNIVQAAAAAADNSFVERNGISSIVGNSMNVTTGIDEDEDDIINNDSLTTDKYALEDELTAYMAELRLREKR